MKKAMDNITVYKPGAGRLILLSIITVLLVSFPPLLFLAPVPLVFVSLFLGRKKGLFLALGVCGVSLLMVGQGVLPPYVAGSSLVCLIYSIVLSEVFFRKIHPVSALFKMGALLIAGLILTVSSISLFGGFSIRGEINKTVVQMTETLKKENVLPKNEKDARQLKTWIEQPDILVDRIYNWLPAGSFIGIFIMLWIGLFITLRNKFGWEMHHSYPYTIRHLIEFKVPSFFVWPLIFSLLLVLAGEHIVGGRGTIMGMNLLYGLSVFYLFQGFGVCLDFFSSLRIYSFIKSLLVILILLVEIRVLVLVGIFDYWIDFRRFFNKDKKKGNIL